MKNDATEKYWSRFSETYDEKQKEAAHKYGVEYFAVAAKPENGEQDNG